jgi:hypothetical protein
MPTQAGHTRSPDDPTIQTWLEVPDLGPAGRRAGRAHQRHEVMLRCAIVVRSVADGRDVAQFGSALDWGSRGRRFKSGRPDW